MAIVSCMKNDTQKQRNIIKNCIISVIALVALVSLVLSVLNMQHYRSMGDASMKYGQQVGSDHLQLKFCYERHIIPCDDITLKEWNTAHPNDAIHPYRG